MATIRLFLLVAIALLITIPSQAQLIHHYPLTNDVRDAVGTDDGTLMNGAKIESGALQLDGVDDYIQFATKIVPTSGSYSVAFFAFQKSDQSNQYIEFISQPASGGHWYIGHSIFGTIRCTDKWETNVSIPKIGQWNHYALIIDDQSKRFLLYVNGELKSTLNENNFPVSGFGSKTRFGRQFDPHSEFFHGSMRDVRIYGNVLSLSEVQTLAGQKIEVPKNLIVASVKVPSTVRPDREYAGTIEYSNFGTDPAPVPLFLLKNESLVPIRFSNREAWRKGDIQILGLGSDAATPNTLKPGEYLRIPFYFLSSGSSDQINFKVVQLLADTKPLNFAEVETSVKPESVSDGSWAPVWANLKSKVGATWADYIGLLTNNATYLAQSGQRTVDVRRLLEFERVKAANELSPRLALASAVDASVPSPGMSLAFGRTAYTALDERFRLGILGRGWTHNLEYRLVRPEPTRIVVYGPGGSERTFRNEGLSGWQGSVGDVAQLTEQTLGQVQIREKDGLLWRFGSDGSLLYLEDTNKNRVTLTYSGGLLAQIAHTSGAFLKLAYYPNARLASVTDSFGRAVAYGYDASGSYLTSVTYPGNRQVQYQYNPAGADPAAHALNKITLPDGTSRSYNFDAVGRLVKEFAGNNIAPIEYAYDAFGTVAVKNAQNQVSTAKRGATGELLMGQNPLGHTLKVSYDDAFNIAGMTAPDGTVAQFAYDSADNGMASLDPNGFQLKAGYSSLSRLEWINDQKGNTTRYQSDAKGNTTRITYADGSFEAFTYDALGNMLTARNRRGLVTTYGYDSLGRVTSKQVAGGRSYTYGYDARGNLASATDSVTGTITMEYDGRDFLTKITYPGNAWFTFEYDAAGKRTKRTGYNGAILTYSYDPVGRLVRVADGANLTLAAYEFDSVGRMSKQTRGNANYTTYVYDAAGRLKDICYYHKSGTLQQKLTYSYDVNGNPTSLLTKAGTWLYTYDKLGQLTSVTPPGGAKSTLEYDPAGNRIALTEGTVRVPYTTNVLNQYTQVGTATYSYDTDGNLISRTDATGTTRFDFDAENRLVRVTAPNGTFWDYTYDALGNRVAVNRNGTITQYVHDPAGLGDVAIETRNGSPIAQYAHGFGLIAKSDSTGTYFYDSDLTGNTRQLTNAAGDIVNAYEYKPFGGYAAVIENIQNPFGYVGGAGVMEEGNGLQYMRARYYDSATGRFISPDPIGLAGGDVNFYRYGNNTPVIASDPTGLIWWFFLPALEAAIAGGGTVAIGGATLTTTEAAILGTAATGTAVALSQNQPHQSFPSLPSFRIPPIIPGQPSTGTGTGGKPGGGGGTGTGTGGKPGGGGTGTGTGGKPGGGGTGTGTGEHPWRHPKGGWMATILEPILGALPGGRGGSGSQASSSGNQSGLGSGRSNVGRSSDPNEIVGPPGIGVNRNVRVLGDGSLEYMIFFENIRTATAAAQEVFVTCPLDANLDPATFTLGSIAFGGQNGQLVSALSGLPSGTYRIPLKNTPYVVDVAVTLVGNQAKWTLRTIDPRIENYPEDPLAGFLSPNDDTGRGEGYVSFRIQARAGVAHGTVIRESASIVFDTNAPIITNTWSNRVDRQGPTSAVGALPATSPTVFPVAWSGQDDTGGAGIASYDIFVAENNGAYTKWLTGTTATTALFGGLPGRKYQFYSIATDAVGNVQASPGAIQTTTVGNTPANVTGQISVLQGRITYDRITRLYYQTVTLTNTGTSAVPGPISLVLDSLSASARLVNRTGVTAATSPVGSSFINVVASGGTLLPGKQVSTTLQFSSSSTTISYTPRVLAGEGSR